MIKNPVLYKSLVVGVIVLFVGVSAIQGNSGSITEDNTINTQNLKVEDCSEEILSPVKYGYAYKAYPHPEKTVYFPLDNLSDIKECGDTISGDFLTGGTIDSNGIWYATQYDTDLLYVIDTNNGCDMWFIGGENPSPTELAWDDETALLYSISGYNLYWYDPETGEGGYLGKIDVSLSQIEFDNTGTFYGFEFDFFGTKKMYTIDLSTLEVSLIGNLINITSSGTLRAAFDKDTNNLYLLGYGPHLYICDTETCECTLIWGKTSGIDLTSFVIPYGDTTPPVTTHSLDPPEPDGLNGWYVSDVNVTLTATDDISSVNITYYRINSGEWLEYSEPFTLSKDGNDILIEYYSMDNAENVEEVKSFRVDIDQTEPKISLCYEVGGGNWWQGYNYVFTAIAEDSMSDMDYVVFYMNYLNMSTVYGSGPDYKWEVTLPGFLPNTFNVRGLIYDLEINEDYVKFKALFVRVSRYYQQWWRISVIVGVRGYDKAGNMDFDETWKSPNTVSITPGIYIFKSIVLPNNYFGYIGKNRIFARFNIN